MNDQNDKLDSLIKTFQKINPSPEQSITWYLAIEGKIRRRRSFYQTTLSLAAGIVIGILLGGYVLRVTLNEPTEEFSATFAQVTVNNLVRN